jgi:hypothetical protein
MSFTEEEVAYLRTQRLAASPPCRLTANRMQCRSDTSSTARTSTSAAGTRADPQIPQRPGRKHQGRRRHRRPRVHQPVDTALSADLRHRRTRRSHRPVRARCVHADHAHSPTASGCAASGGQPSPGDICAPRGKRSTRWARSRGANVPGRNCGPPAKPAAAAPRTPATNSRRRNCRSPRWPPRD